MPNRKAKNREFQGKNPFFSGGTLIFIAFIAYMAMTADWDVLASTESTGDGIIVMGILLAIPTLAFFSQLFGTVYVGRNSNVYHSKHGCAGATNKINRMNAKNQGLQPCARCHKIKGMGR